MRELTSITYEIQRPSDGVQRVTDQATVKWTRALAEGFLEGGVDAGRLACLGCEHAILCGAVANEVSGRYGHDYIPRNDHRLLASHGIDIDPSDNTICPGRLVDSALERTKMGDFWTERDDPVMNEPLELQAVDALRIATGDVIRRLDSGQRI